MATHSLPDGPSRRGTGPRRTALRIALVADAARERAVELAEDLTRQGHRIHLVRRRLHRWEQPTRQENWRETLMPALPIPGQLGHLWREQPVDLVHLLDDSPLAAVCAWAAHRERLPLSLDAPTPNGGLRGHRLRQAWRRQLQRLAHGVLVPDLHAAALLREQGVPRLRLAPHGLDLHAFHPSQRSFSLRHQWGLRADTPVLAHLGPVDDGRTVAALRAAMEALIQVDADARLLLVGCDRIPAPLQALRPLHDENWQGRLLPRPGGERQPSLATQLASADLLLVPDPGRQPQLIAQGLACGLAVIARRNGHSETLLEDGHTGYLVDTIGENAQAYADTVRLLYASPAALARLRMRAPASVAHLERGHAATRLAAVLGDLVRSHARCRQAATTLVVATDT